VGKLREFIFKNKKKNDLVGQPQKVFKDKNNKRCFTLFSGFV